MELYVADFKMAFLFGVGDKSLESQKIGDLRYFVSHNREKRENKTTFHGYGQIFSEFGLFSTQIH